MNRLNRKIDYLGLSLGHGVILAATVLVFVMLIIATSGVFVKSMEYPVQPYYKITEPKYILPDSVKELPKDSLVNIIRRIEEIERRQELVLNDLRQEGNNNINKVNGWLAFWVAILAIFGGVVPIVIQYILRGKSKREIEEIIDKITDRVENTRIQVMVSCMNANHRFSLITDNSHRNQFLSWYSDEAYRSFCEILDRIEAEEGRITQEDEVNLLAALIQYCRLMETVSNYLSGRRVRHMRNLRNEVKTVIEDILNHQNHTRLEIWLRLLDLKHKLSSIPLPEED